MPFLDWWNYSKLYRLVRILVGIGVDVAQIGGSKREEITVVVPAKPYQPLTLRYLKVGTYSTRNNLNRTSNYYLILAFKSAAKVP